LGILAEEKHEEEVEEEDEREEVEAPMVLSRTNRINIRGSYLTEG